MPKLQMERNLLSPCVIGSSSRIARRDDGAQHHLLTWSLLLVAIVLVVARLVTSVTRLRRTEQWPQKKCARHISRRMKLAESGAQRWWQRRLLARRPTMMPVVLVLMLASSMANVSCMDQTAPRPLPRSAMTTCSPVVRQGSGVLRLGSLKRRPALLARRQSNWSSWRLRWCLRASTQMNSMLMRRPRRHLQIPSPPSLATSPSPSLVRSLIQQISYRTMLCC